MHGIWILRLYFYYYFTTYRFGFKDPLFVLSLCSCPSSSADEFVSLLNEDVYRSLENWFRLKECHPLFPWKETWTILSEEVRHRESTTQGPRGSNRYQGEATTQHLFRALFQWQSFLLHDHGSCRKWKIREQRNTSARKSIIINKCPFACSWRSCGTSDESMPTSTFYVLCPVCITLYALSNCYWTYNRGLLRSMVIERKFYCQITAQSHHQDYPALVTANGQKSEDRLIMKIWNQTTPDLSFKLQFKSNIILKDR